jgi:hypothetical protein
MALAPELFGAFFKKNKNLILVFLTIKRYLDVVDHVHYGRAQFYLEIICILGFHKKIIWTNFRRFKSCTTHVPSSTFLSFVLRIEYKVLPPIGNNYW